MGAMGTDAGSLFNCVEDIAGVAAAIPRSVKNSLLQKEVFESGLACWLRDEAFLDAWAPLTSAAVSLCVCVDNYKFVIV